MLKFLFEWFDTHAQSYWVIAAIPTLGLLAWSALLVRRDSAPAPSGSKRQEVLFAWLLLAVLVAWRWPFLLSADEYNPDESQLIAGALTLHVDPVPWRSVDGTTSGPLNFYPLLPIPLLGLPLDYFTARLSALLLIWGALLACYRLLRSWFGSAVARLGILPGLAFFSSVTDREFIHHSSEHLSILLIALSASWLLRPRQPDSAGERRELAGCFVAGMLPWAKLQSAPLAATLVAISLFLVMTDRTRANKSKWRAGFKRVLAAAAPTLLVLAVVAATGQFGHFARSYVLQNFAYVSGGTAFPLLDLARASKATGHFPFFVIISLFGAGAGLVAASRTRRGMVPLLIGGALVAASGFCILTPRRAALHYVLFSIVPLVIWFGHGLGAWWNTATLRNRSRIGWLALAIGGVVPFGFRATQPVPAMFGNFLNHWTEPRCIFANVMKRFAPPDARVATWGWAPYLNVQTGLPQGTRDGNTYWAIMPSPQREYFRLRFLSDLMQNQPALFVDSVGDDGFFFTDRAQSGHESFPPLAAYIQQHYKLVLDEANRARLYARRDLEPKIVPHESPSYPQTQAEHERVIGLLPLESMSPPDLPQWRMRAGFAQLMHPPAELVWSLDDSTREIMVEYGLAPEAYRHARSDGAELIFELRSEGVPVRHLFQRFLDPTLRPADRGAQLLRLPLPPFKPGARLVARTTRGKSGDGAWDWLYLSRVIPIRQPGYSPTQFPHFNRVPDSADADLSYLLEEAGDTTLILHAPSALTYHLDGKERRLRFDYGFLRGAYSNGGQTDGAIFQVELRRNEAPPQILFQKELAPTNREEDRGSHSAELAIPPGSDGAKLIVRTDPGRGNAWDWTYITHLQIEPASP